MCRKSRRHQALFSYQTYPLLIQRSPDNRTAVLSYTDGWIFIYKSLTIPDCTMTILRATNTPVVACLVCDGDALVNGLVRTHELRFESSSIIHWTIFSPISWTLA